MKHPTPPWSKGEHCAVCGKKARHKVQEECNPNVHGLSTYLCCKHLRRLGMDCRTMPPSAYSVTAAFRVERTTGTPETWDGLDRIASIFAP